MSCWGAGSLANTRASLTAMPFWPKRPLLPGIATPTAVPLPVHRPRSRCASRRRRSRSGDPDPSAPWCDDPADGAEVGTVGMFLVQTADDVRCNADEGAQCRHRTDGVFPPVPRGAEELGDLLEVIDEKPPRLLAEVVTLPARTECVGRQGFLSSCASGAWAMRP